MKNLLILATMLLMFGFSNAQTFDKSLAGMYESTSGSDWVALKNNGTGKLYITSEYMNLGTFSFTWTSDDDQVFINYYSEYDGYETSKWSYWSKKNGVYILDFPTFGPYLNFIKTE